MGLSHSGRRIVTTGLLLCVDAGNVRSYPGSGTTWIDLTGRGNNLTMSAGCTYSSSFSGVMSFNGSGTASIASTSDVAFSTGDYAIECWFRTTSSVSGYSFIFDVGAGTLQTIRFGDTGFGNLLQTAANPTSTSTVWSTAITKTTALNAWYHGVLTRTSGTNTFWLNNSIQNINSGVNPSTYPFTSFSDTSGSASATSLTLGSGLTGNIGMLRVYNNALTSAQISQNFNATRGRYGI